ncbi:MAG TPA: winged helix-turn-helix domain-containing protein [Vicinamibacteria bacterium]|nr:winged helix-turn-helix domain-containing protein [Vicinamibacteria bacterium]
MGAEPDLLWSKAERTRRFRFGVFELDPRGGELWKAGVRTRLQPQPARVLALLAGRPGDLVTREEIQREVWPEGTFVDFEQSLNFCIRQIRTALGDQAATPRYVETLPRRGYRLLVPVEVVGGDAVPVPARPDREPATVQSFPAPALAPSRWRRLRRSTALTLLGLVVGAAATKLLLPPPPPVVPAFQRVTFGRGYLDSARFGPEGQVIYTAAWEGRPVEGFLLRAASLDARPLPHLGPRILAVTRPGDLLFVTDTKKTLSRAPLAGGPAKALLEGVVAADAAPIGEDLAVARVGEGRSARIEYPVGRVLGTALRPSVVRISRDGRSVAILEHPIVGDDRGRVVLFDDSGQRRVLSESWASIHGLAWSPDGREVWFTGTRVGADSALHAVDLEGRVRTLVPALGRLILHDVLPDGRVLLERTTLESEVRFRGPGDGAERDLPWLDLPRVAQVSRDGRFVLFYESGEGGGADYGTWLRAVDGTVPVRLGTGRAMSLSADGRFAVVIPVDEPDRVDLLPIGPGEVRSLREPGIAEFQWAALTPDGASLVFTGAGSTQRPRVYVRPLDAGPARPITPEGVGVWTDGLAPDGSALAVVCGEGLCLHPLDGGPARELASTGKMVPVGWAGPGTLVARDASRIPARLVRFDLATGGQTPWHELGPHDTSGVRRVSAVALSADGSAYAYSFTRQVSDLYSVTGLK